MSAHFSGFDPDNLYSNPDGVLVGLKNVQKRLKIFFSTVDEDGVHTPYDPDTISVIVENTSETIIVQGDLAGGFITKEADGIYYIDTDGIVPATYDLVSNTPRTYILKWQYKDTPTSEPALALSYFYVIGTKTQMWFPRLRNAVDKAFKLTGCGRVGFTDGNMYYYLQGGLDEINKFPPVTNFMLINWPDQFGQLLIDSAAVVAVTSQALFSIDTDVGTYSDQGFSFTTDHFSRLNTMMGGLLQKIERELRMFKMEYNQLGSINVMMVPYYPLGVVLRTSPAGSLFRNLFVSR